MSSFNITPVEKGIMRCKHSGQFTPDEVQTLAKFLEDYKGKLLVDLTGSSSDECARNIKHLRPMMPTAAIFGAELPADILDVPESYYTHEVKIFNSEAEALDWLRNQ
ncbi:MAG: STAS/SEC14 domain-containing protein [Ignavibacteriaceae bacterium]